MLFFLSKSSDYLCFFPFPFNSPNAVVLNVSASNNSLEIALVKVKIIFFSINLKDTFSALNFQKYWTLLTTLALGHILHLASVTLHLPVLNKLPDCFQFCFFYIILFFFSTIVLSYLLPPSVPPFLSLFFLFYTPPPLSILWWCFPGFESSLFFLFTLHVLLVSSPFLP